MQPWTKLARAVAPDGIELSLERRGDEFLIRADGLDLMSNLDEASSRSLSELGTAHIGPRARARVLVGGLGMGFTLSEALRRVGPSARVECAEFVDAVVEWNMTHLGSVAGHPLRDSRASIVPGDVSDAIRAARSEYDAILLDVDNGPDALAHDANDRIYDAGGIVAAQRALRPDGVLAVWSIEDDRRFTRRLEQGGFDAKVHRVEGSRKGRGRKHVIWVATKKAVSKRTGPSKKGRRP